ncbi:2-succinyl-5-enolpyruvyl-6-hydroxy-3-cyclohexene-1-carboxylic-acid synthase [Blattabacterium cuenoti]|uniref:2-succinyl-5-enolpyruvyl-6-hydroxy-3- cyclohexene-1-carboxylic-acid synthase n=1 Tax=Blattabacterium cuenoti TaxID=1653831 RepID=UPI00163BC1E2|nr:2-succinyl-5-enolpyruvyl-6-hydroxy-3-cyclohexene-1-carboxylic-acid synthase [Blattabacterium cuenoti]
MFYSNKKVVQILGEILKANYIFNIVISPGSRNAPIIIHFTQDKTFKTYSIIDERCAAFFALGIAQKSRKPVVINCTSGSSVVNYYPAITEAFYQKIPIIIITADRPKEIIDIFEGQSIYQENIFNNHVEKFVQLTEDESKNGLWYNNKLINESINSCIITKRPIHINIPFSEPLYERTNKLKIKPTIIKTFFTKKKIDNLYKEIIIWNKCKKKMILLGLNNYDDIINLNKIIKKISLDSSTIVFAETTSHLYDNMFISNIDYVLFGMNIEKWKKLKPQILLTFGINIISKKIKLYLRKYPPKYHWHIGECFCKNYPDTYYNLTSYFPIDPKSFFHIITNSKYCVLSNYRNNWKTILNKKIIKQKSFLKKEKRFSDLNSLFLIFSMVPKGSILQLGNSMIIRYYQFFNNKKNKIKSYCNRGTSGIEGCVSTAIGYSINSDKIVTLIIGDISFFYDSNALFNNYTPNNFRIILINNGKGNIFKIISENKIPKKTLNFLETKHNHSAKKLCEMHNWNYKKVDNYNKLKKILFFFWKKFNNPFLLEVDTRKCNNEKIFKEFLLYS